MLKTIKSREGLQKAQEEHRGFLVLAFCGDFSQAARRGLAELKEFSREQNDVPVYVIDVEKV